MNPYGQQNRFATRDGQIPASVNGWNLDRGVLLAGVNGIAGTGAEMDDGSTPRHAPDHMPPPGATGAPQHTRDAPLRGDPALDGDRPPVTSPPRVTPSAARGGLSAGGIAMPVAALVVVLLLLVLSMVVLR